MNITSIYLTTAEGQEAIYEAKSEIAMGCVTSNDEVQKEIREMFENINEV